MALSRGSSVEVVSEEHFQQRRDGIADKCIDCIKQRGGVAVEKESKKSRRRKKKEQIVRVNSPIVVRLRDTIKLSNRRKAASPKSSDTSPSSTDTEDNLDMRRNSSRNESLRAKAIKGSMCKKEGKNFASFLSAVEQIHLKEHQACAHMKAKLFNQNVLCTKDHTILLNTSGSVPLLNNLRGTQCSHHCSNSAPSQPLRSIDATDNVKLVRNDLHGRRNISKQNSIEESENSSITSSDCQSDISESGSTSGDSEVLSRDEELSRDELDYLSSFTTGVPLTRYDCPQCTSTRRSYAACLSAPSVVSVQVRDDVTITSPEVSPSPTSTGSESASDVDSSSKEDRDSPDITLSNNINSSSTYQLSGDTAEVSLQGFYSDPVPDQSQNDHSKHKKTPGQRRSTNRNKDYSGAHYSYSSSPRSYHDHSSNAYNNYFNNACSQSLSCPNSSSWTPHNSVFVDLTNSDVTVEVEYHSQGTSSGCSRNSYEQGSSNNGTFQTSDGYFQMNSYNSYAGAVGFFPYALPYYLTPPYYYMYPLVMSIPRPICVPRDTQCLTSQRMCLIPAHEAKSFTASQPSPRPWLPLASPELNNSVAIYTVMCYNVLCDMYCTRSLYGYCPSWALTWEYRKKTIIEEIRQYSADILSLQEVETEQFYSFFLPELKRDGYNGIFSPKSRAKTMADADKKRVDGCAIFYKVAKFTLIKDQLVEFNQLAMSNAEGSHEMINRVMTKDNIGLCAVLETKDAVWEHGLPTNASARQTFMVATCHIHWDPEYSDVKLIQTMMFIKEMKKIAEANNTRLRPGGGSTNQASLPVILCGDLNSLPESGVVEFLNNSRVSCCHEDFKDIRYHDCLKKLDLDENRQIYTHDFKLTSAYDPSVMPFTNYTYDFKGIIDYIFYSRDVMRPLGVLGPLDAEWFRLNKVQGCPHPHIPSDHLPLLVEIEMSPAVTSSPVLTSSSGRPSMATSSQSTISSSSRPMHSRR